METNKQDNTVTITTTVSRGGKKLETSVKVTPDSLLNLGPENGNKALNDITKQLYNKTNENIKKALNDNI